MENFDFFLKIISGVAAILGIVLTLSHIYGQKHTGKVKKYEIYKDLKKYLDDPSNKDFSAICAAFNCIIKRKITLEECTWFVKTPNAFNYIEDYCRQENYIEISERKDSFIYSGKFKKKKK